MSYWLASYPKSGNTWVKLFVEAYAIGNTNINAPRITSGDQSRQFYHSACCVDLKNLSHVEILAIREAALSNMKNMAHPYLVKTHHANVMLHEHALIPSWFTNGAVYVMRDPRDVAISMSHYFYDMTIDKAIDKMLNDTFTINFKGEPNFYHFCRSWKSHVESWLAASFPLLVMRYENMVDNPYTEFKRLIEFHPWLEYDHDRLTKAIDEVTFAKLRDKEQADGFKESRGMGDFFRAGTARQWRDVLTAPQQRRLAPLVEYYEYAEAA